MGACNTTQQSSDSTGNSQGNGSSQQVGETVNISFASLTGNGTVLDTATLDAVLPSGVTSSNLTNAYNGNSTGGAFADTAGLVKLGKSGGPGTMTLTTTKAVVAVDVTMHSWYVESEEYGSTPDKLSINGVEQWASTTGTAESVTFNLTTAATVLNFATIPVVVGTKTYQRVFIFNIALHLVA